MLKRLLINLLCAAALLFSIVAFAADVKAPVQPLDHIVAVVNKEAITASQLQAALKNAHTVINARHLKAPSASVLKREVLTQLINQRLQLQIAKRNGIKVSNAQLNKAIASIASKNKLSVTALKAKLKQSGMSYTVYRQQIRAQIMISMAQRQAIMGTIKKDPAALAKLRAKYKNFSAATSHYHLADIVISVPSNATQDQFANAKARAKAIVKKLAHGADFKRTAVLESNGANALKGGDMGWQTKADLPDLFSAQLSNMKVGQVVGPIQAPNGFHILKLLGKRSHAQKLTDKQLQNLVMRQQFQTKLQAWIKQLRKSAYIKIYE